MPERYYVTHEFKFRGLPRKIFQRGSPHASWEIRISLNGKQIPKSLGTSARDSAVEIAKRILQAGLEGRVSAALDSLRPPSEQTKSTVAAVTVGQVVTIFQGAPGQAKPATRYGYICALKRVIEVSLGTMPVWKDRDLSELNEDLVIRYGEIKEKTALGKGMAALSRARNGGISTLRQARMIFTRELLHYYSRRAGLVLPSMDGFRNTPGFGKGRNKDYQPPPDWLIAKTFAELESSREDQPDRYLVCWLALGFGLRKSEISAVRADWFVPVAGRIELELRAVSGRMGYGESEATKNGQLIPRIPVANDAWTRLGPLIDAMAPGAYVIGGTMTWRLDGVFREVNEWLRNLGWKTQKGIHELRAYAGCQVISRDGMLQGSLWLRHGDMATTQRYYGRYVTMRVTDAPMAAVPTPKTLQKPRGDLAGFATSFATSSPVEIPSNSIASGGNFVQYISDVKATCDSNTMTYTCNSL
jgi:integrase